MINFGLALARKLHGLKVLDCFLRGVGALVVSGIRINPPVPETLQFPQARLYKLIGWQWHLDVFPQVSFNLYNSQLLDAGGRIDFYDIPNAIVKKGLANRRVIGDLALQRIGLGASHQQVAPLPSVGSLDCDRRTELHSVGGVRALLRHDGVGEDVLEVTDATLDECLLVLDFLVLSVVHSSAALGGYMEPRGHIGPPRGAELVEFIYKLSMSFGSKKTLTLIHVSSPGCPKWQRVNYATRTLSHIQHIIQPRTYNVKLGAGARFG